MSKDKIISDYFAEIGRKGGKASRGGGRPRLKDEEMTPDQKARRERYEKQKERQGKKKTL